VSSVKIYGLQRLSKEYIEAKTEQIVNDWFPEYVNKLWPFPLEKFCDRIQNDYKIFVVRNASLGLNTSGQKIFGCLELKPLAIYVDGILKDDVRYPFVLAHELGHLVLHRTVDFEKSKYESIQDVDNNFRGRECITDVDWMEWQANRFAAALLMPRRTLKRALDKAQKAAGLGGYRGRIYVSNAAYHLKDFDITIEEMARIYGVSKTNIEYRLKSYGYIQDDRTLGSHISRYIEAFS
jgi:Zn-dependent peptidase ImmA (M78 family)